MPEELVIARGVEAGYPGKKILFGVDFEVCRGEVVALLGANGSGKSTALRTIAGLLEPSEGSVRVLCAEAVAQSPAFGACRERLASRLSRQCWPAEPRPQRRSCY